MSIGWYKRAASEDAVTVYSIQSGLNPSGIDLGSPSFEDLDMPSTAIIGGEGTRSYNVGEIRHLFDQRYHMPITILEKDEMGGADLSRYNTLIMVDGYYSDLSSGVTEELKSWVRKGGTLILNQDAISWAKGEGAH